MASTPAVTRRSALVPALWLTVALCSHSVHATQGKSNTDAASYLAFESQGDGRCQILSSGGKLRVVYNRHQERAIEFRLLRVFAGHHPQGLSVGVAPAGGAAVKLGCTEVDGRPQDWIVDRARFAP